MKKGKKKRRKEKKRLKKDRKKIHAVTRARPQWTVCLAHTHSSNLTMQLAVCFVSQFIFCEWHMASMSAIP